MEKTLYEYLRDLSSWNPPQVQQAAIEAIDAAVSRDAGILAEVVHMSQDKYEWSTRAKIVCMQSDKALERYVPRMLEWLKDMNWPGAELMYERLEGLEEGYVDRDIENAMKWAQEDGRRMWLRALWGLKKDRRERRG